MDEMVSLAKALVPHYLVGSEFYNSLSADDEEEFSIPRKFLKPNVIVASGAELENDEVARRSDRTSHLQVEGDCGSRSRTNLRCSSRI